VIIKEKNTYFLASDSMWFDAPAVKGPWSEARSLSKDLKQIDEQLKKQRAEQGVEEPEATDEIRVPQIVVSTVPAELIFIDGKPEFEPLQGNDILAVSNTDSDVIFDIDTQNYYVLLSGRWYRAKDLDRPLHLLDRFWQGRLLGPGPVPAVPTLRLRRRLPGGLSPRIRPRTPPREADGRRTTAIPTSTSTTIFMGGQGTLIGWRKRRIEPGLGWR
jgi:hypothetical protein